MVENEVQQLTFPHFDHLVSSVESDASSGLLEGVEMFMFTDNAVAESAFFKGTSINKQLHALVLRLRRIELDYSLKLHIIHISGKRMMAQGTDGLSRGDPFDGVMQGVSFLDFVPIHLSALDRSHHIIPWCMKWIPSTVSLLPLTPLDWFVKGHGIVGGAKNTDGIWSPTFLDLHATFCLWCPPPSAADVAIEQLSFSRHKRPELTHIFVCPRLMTYLWRKRLFKFADFTFSLPAGHNPMVWPESMFEPLTIGVLLPFLPSPPWVRRNSPPLLALEGELRSVWQTPQRDECAILRKLWI